MSEPVKKKGVKRRKFLKYSGVGIGLMIGGIFLTKSKWRRGLASFAYTAEAPYMGPTSPDLWIQIMPNNRVILHSSKVEMGQGTFTSLAQIVADELEVNIDVISVVHAETKTGNIDGMSTGGSTSVSGLWQPLREMSATMREMIKAKAAEKMKVDPSSISMVNGMATSGNASLSYGEVVDGVTEWKFPDTPVLKDLKDYRYIGKGIPRVDLHDKVIGAPMFGIDSVMPGMVYGAVARPERVDEKYAGCDYSEAKGMPGVIEIVEENDFVGVVAESMMEAIIACEKIKVNWEIARSWDLTDIEDMIKVGAGTPHVIQKVGKTDKTLEDAEDMIQMEFKTPIGAHAQIEPNGAVASVEDGKATIMLSTQVVNITRKEVAARLGFKVKDVNVIPRYLGGGFGRRLHTPNAIQAAVMSNVVGRPVKCFFSRKQEFQNDTFRPPTHHVLKASLNSDRNIDAIEHNVSSGDVLFGSALAPGFTPSILGADLGAWRGGMIQYAAIPNHQAISWRVKLPFATSFWRSLGLLANTFAIESFMDHLAIKAGKNPVEFRLGHIQDDKAGNRLKAVIEACAKKSGYKDKVTNGRAMGFCRLDRCQFSLCSCRGSIYCGWRD